MLQDFPKDSVLKNSENTEKLLLDLLEAEDEHDKDKEHMWVIGLTSRNRVKFIDLVGMGTSDAQICFPKEVFRVPIEQSVRGIILAHNHPSGETTPSQGDTAVTETIWLSGEILGIDLLDHVIVSEEEEKYSYREDGFMEYLTEKYKDVNFSVEDFLESEGVIKFSKDKEETE